MHHAVSFNFDFAKVCSPAILETCFSYNKEYGLLQLIIISTFT